MKLITPTICLLLACFTSCTDESDFQLILEKEISGPYGNYVLLYQYNDRGLFVGFEDYFDNKLTSWCTYTYSDELLISASSYLINADNEIEKYRESSILYNPNKQIIQVSTSEQYDALTRDIIHRIVWLDERIEYIERIENEDSTKWYLEYDASNNISRTTAYTNDGSIQYILDFEYDDRQNPKYLQKDPLNILLTPFGDGSPNNIKKMTQRSWTGGDPIAITEYIYTYNSKELPIECVTKVTSLGSTSESKIWYVYRVL